MTADRHLDWDGCYNVRDLGGLRTIYGRTTRWGAVVRADAPDRLTPAGWSALKAYGIRTIIDLRNDEERHADTTPHAAKLTTVHVPLDDPADLEFWQHWRDSGLWATPLYYRPFLDRKPQRCAAAVAAVAHAQPGGVLVHCGGGRDRTGLIALLVLALVGVAPDDIAADYELSIDRLRLFYARTQASRSTNSWLARIPLPAPPSLPRWHRLTPTPTCAPVASPMATWRPSARGFSDRRNLGLPARQQHASLTRLRHSDSCDI